MSALPRTTGRTASLGQELDAARRNGRLRQIVIPPCPELLTELQQALATAEPDLTRVARIASSDVAMSATLIRSANSPLYAAHGQPVQTIGQALNRLGLEESARVMTAFLTRQAIRVDSPHLHRFWERASRCATAMAYIADRLPGMSADLAYTYGLFCDVGMPVMMQSFKGYGATLVEARARVDRPFIATENANHRADHAVVGALVARTWQLAPVLVAALRLHHDWSIFDDEGTEPEIKSLVAAGLVAEHLMRCHEGLQPESDWSHHAAAALGWLSISAEDLSAWQEESLPLLDAA